MKERTPRAHARTAAAAALLVLAGGLAGIAVDRLWILPSEAPASPLTVDALVERLGLDGPEEAEIRALMDSLHAEVVTAARAGPDSLAAAARSAHRRIEGALPADARPAFRAWVRDHHGHAMGRLDDPAP